MSDTQSPGIHVNPEHIVFWAELVISKAFVLTFYGLDVIK